MSGILAGLGSSSSSRALTVGVALGATNVYGFQSSIIGSLTPTEFLGSNINQLKWLSNNLVLSINDTSHTNSGWSSVNINGNVFLRTAATYSAGAWTWTPVSNPVGTSAGVILPVDIA